MKATPRISEDLCQSLDSWLINAYKAVLFLRSGKEDGDAEGTDGGEGQESEGNGFVETFLDEEERTRKIIFVASHIFGLDASATIGHVHEAIISYFEREIGDLLLASQSIVIEACLICAVSTTCSDRATFVQDIMNMPPHDQVNLMTCIRNDLSTYTVDESLEEGADDDDDEIEIRIPSKASGPVLENQCAEDENPCDDSRENSCDSCDDMETTTIMERDVSSEDKAPSNDSSKIFDTSFNASDSQMVFSQNDVQEIEQMKLANSSHNMDCDDSSERDLEVDGKIKDAMSQDIDMEYNNDDKIKSRSPSSGNGAVASSSSSSSRGLFFVSSDSSSCSTCAERALQIDQLQISLEASLQREREIESKLKGEVAQAMNRLVDAEIAVIDREEQISKRNSLINEAESKIRDLEEALREQSKMVKNLADLQDELDILRPQAEKLDASERQVERLRERLDELSAVRQQLKTESAAHEETHSRLLVAEKELDSLRNAKKQLEEYRSQYSEAVIKIEELTLRLQKRDAEINSLLKDNETLNDGHQGHLQQSQHLMEELRATSEHLRTLERTGGIGESVSELNPALMQELHRLRAENEALLVKIDASSMESLEKLEKDIADQKCINNSLQQKWVSTKDSLALACATINQLNAKVTSLEAELCRVNACFEEASLMGQEELMTFKWNHKRKVDHLLLAQKHSQDLLHVGHMSVRGDVLQCLGDTEKELNETKQQVADLLLVKSDLENLQANTEKSLQEETQNREKDNIDHQENVRQLKEAHERVIAQLKSKEEEKFAQISQQHARELEAERENSRNLAADVEEERRKRRKTEREKKIYEAEAHRHKAQLSVAGNSSGTEVVTAIKEMKQMQQQLDAANLEIQALKARNNSDAAATSGLQHETLNASSTTSANSSSHPDKVSGMSDGNGNAAPQGTVATVGRLGSSRPMRVKVSDRDISSSIQNSADTAAPLSSGAFSMSGAISGVSGNGGCFGGFLEHSELTDKRIEQLTRERREMIAKNLEENKERMELSQKLLASEKEVAALKSKITKITLEKERLERKLLKNDGPSVEDDDEEGEKENLKKQKLSHNVSSSTRSRRSALESM